MMNDNNYIQPIKVCSYYSVIQLFSFQLVIKQKQHINERSHEFFYVLQLYISIMLQSIFGRRSSNKKERYGSDLDSTRLMMMVVFGVISILGYFKRAAIKQWFSKSKAIEAAPGVAPLSSIPPSAPAVSASQIGLPPSVDLNGQFASMPRSATL